MGKVEEWSSIIENLDLWESFNALMSFLALEDEPEEKQESDKPGPDIRRKRKRAGAFFNYEAPFGYVLQKNWDSSFEVMYDAMGFSHDAFKSHYKIEKGLYEALEPYILQAEESVAFPVELEKGIGESYYTYEKEAYEVLSEREKVPLFNLPSLNDMETVMEEKGGEELFSKADSLFGGPGKGKVGKILSTVKRDEGNTRVHEIKVEMAEHDGYSPSFDVDEMLEKMTERLCNMMAKGADGIYL